ncbi:hypothetical protein Tco_0480510 [Tanacetum coccineum]
MHPIPSKPQPSVKQFIDQLFGTTSSKFSPTPPREPTPPRDSSKGKAVAIIEVLRNELVQYQEEGRSNPKAPKLKPFTTLEGPLSQEEFDKQIKELKRISDLKAEKEKSKQELRKFLNPATLKAQAQKWTEHEAKKAKIMEEYNHQISFRADTLPITKISYVVNSRKEATIKITRGDNPLNLIVHPNFKLKQLGFSEWLEVINQAKRLGLPPPPELAAFRLTVKEKKRKRTEFIKEMFVTKDVRVDGMNRNLTPPPRVVPIKGLVIKEPESGIFYMNRNTDVVIQRESKFYLTPTVELICIQNQIKVNSEIASEMCRSMNYVIEARDDCIEARKIKEYVEVLRRVRGGNTLTILIPFEEEQAELKDCSLMKCFSFHPLGEVINCHDYILDLPEGLGKRSEDVHAPLIEWPWGHNGRHEGFGKLRYS